MEYVQAELNWNIQQPNLGAGTAERQSLVQQKYRNTFLEYSYSLNTIDNRASSTDEECGSLRYYKLHAILLSKNLIYIRPLQQ